MLHLPMQSVANETPEQQELRPGLRRDQVENIVTKMLESVPEADGVNNHQGSQATSNGALMDELMPVLRDAGVFYVDSRTTAGTVAYDTAKRAGVKTAFRNVPFLDDVQNKAAVKRQLQIAIRGANVTRGYANNAKANGEAFANGWFRTGDQGVMDEEGYLTITGRLKEIINRGGEKVSPREVDEVLMDHPAVAQVVTFAVPHDKLGEDIAAAVVLREGAACDERELRSFVGSRVADFKVPRRIVFLTEIPKGATGKL